jgi:F0F1-type ATP synthase delta subunit
MKLNLQDSVYSPQDLKAIILEVRKYAHWAAQYTVKMRVSNDKSDLTPTISQTTTKIIKEWAEQNPLNEKSIGELISSLEALEANSPRITITLPAAPGNSLKKTLVMWFRQNIDADILVDFHFNSTLLGGMVVRYGSHVYDWSFRRQILAARERFPEVLRRV